MEYHLQPPKPDAEQSNAAGCCGSVVLTVANGVTVNGLVGSTNDPTWLQVRVASGGFTLNSGSALYGSVTAPAGTVMVNGNTVVVGIIRSDRLTINSGGIVRAGRSSNQAPTAIAQTRTTAEDTPLSIRLIGMDPEGVALNFSIGTHPPHGTLTGTPPNLSYPPTTSFNGFDSFMFTASDGQGT